MSWSVSHRLAAAHLFPNQEGTCISFGMSCSRQGPQKAYVSAGGIDFARLTKNLTFKVWTENWKGVNTVLLVWWKTNICEIVLLQPIVCLELRTRTRLSSECLQMAFWYGYVWIGLFLIMLALQHAIESSCHCLKHKIVYCFTFNSTQDCQKKKNLQKTQDEHTGFLCLQWEPICANIYKI